MENKNFVNGFQSWQETHFEFILDQMKSKSKANVKQDLKRDFVELLTGCTISFDSDVINYKKGEEWFFYYRKSNNKFYIQYKFWFDFEKKYNLNYKELQELLVDILEEVLNYKGVTPLHTWLVVK